MQEKQNFSEQTNYQNENLSNLENESSPVGMSQTSKVLSLIGIVLFIIIVLYFSFSSDDDEKEEPDSVVYGNSEDDQAATSITPAKAPSNAFEPIIQNIAPEADEVVATELAVPNLPPLEDLDIALPENQFVPDCTMHLD